MMPRKTARRWRRLERARALWAPTSEVAMAATPEADRAPRRSVSVVRGDAMASLRPLSSTPGGTGLLPPGDMANATSRCSALSNALAGDVDLVLRTYGAFVGPVNQIHSG